MVDGRRDGRAARGALSLEPVATTGLAPSQLAPGSGAGRPARRYRDRDLSAFPEWSAARIPGAAPHYGDGLALAPTRGNPRRPDYMLGGDFDRRSRHRPATHGDRPGEA